MFVRVAHLKKKKKSHVYLFIYLSFFEPGGMGCVWTHTRKLHISCEREAPFTWTEKCFPKSKHRVSWRVKKKIFYFHLLSCNICCLALVINSFLVLLFIFFIFFLKNIYSNWLSFFPEQVTMFCIIMTPLPANTAHITPPGFCGPSTPCCCFEYRISPHKKFYTHFTYLYGSVARALSLVACGANCCRALSVRDQLRLSSGGLLQWR